MKKLVLSLLVNNEAGVLTRVSGLFARRGFNISSLSVGETQNPLFSRITIHATGTSMCRTQLVHQLRKLHDVKVVENMELEQTVCRELMLIKVCAGSQTRSQVLEGANVFRAKVLRPDADHRHHGADRGYRQAGRVHHLSGTV